MLIRKKSGRMEGAALEHFAITGNAVVAGEVCEQLHREGTRCPVRHFTAYSLTAQGKGWGDGLVAKCLP